MMYINVYIDDRVVIEDSVKFITFHGNAVSDFFNGTILPGGVDTQLYCEKGDPFMSARYMIRGTDANGRETLLFIQNEGVRVDGQFVTRPLMRTDNPDLKWLEEKVLRGTISHPEPGLTRITFVEAE